jgi:hypothetical protein
LCMSDIWMSYLRIRIGSNIISIHMTSFDTKPQKYQIIFRSYELGRIYFTFAFYFSSNYEKQNVRYVEFTITKKK